MKTRATKNASVIPTSNGFRLSIPSGPGGRYRLSQLDDHAHIARQNYSYSPPFSLELKARVSSQAIPGTWGFGLWNDPFGFSFGPEDTFLRLPALPNALWFFCASPQNYLSFQNDPSTGSGQVKPANGFLAQSFRSPKFHPLLLPAGMALPFSRKKTRQILSRIIEEDSAAVSVDSTQWHSYRLEWSQTRSAFWVDNVKVLESPVSPNPPLGLVIWIDNQYAAFRPEGKISMGLLAGKEEWLEIENLVIRNA